MRITIKATVSNIQFGKVFFQLPNGEQISIVREQWSGPIEIGAEIALLLMPYEDAAAEQNELAKKLINQLLSNDD